MRPTAIALSGGGARAAYQVGFLRCLSRLMPEVRFPIVTGVSAGAINATFLAAHRRSTADAAEELTELWTGLSPEKVFRTDTLALAGSALRWTGRLVSGGSAAAPRTRGLLDTSPLSRLVSTALGSSGGGEIRGIAENLECGALSAFALSTLKYATGQTVTWVQGCDIRAWERPDRLGVKTRITVDHVMASAALPILFPAVQLDGSWYGDGGIRLYTPLAPAIHLGAERIVAISTRYPRTPREAGTPAVRGYPPPAQVAGVLLNAVFLDAIDQDALRLDRINRLLREVPPAAWGGLRPVELLVLRPSVDLGRLAAEFEPRLPGAFRFLTRGLGTRETSSPDLLSLLMFQKDYLGRLIAIGEADAEARADDIRRLLEG